MLNFISKNQVIVLFYMRKSRQFNLREVRSSELTLFLDASDKKNLRTDRELFQRCPVDFFESIQILSGDLINFLFHQQREDIGESPASAESFTEHYCFSK